MPEYKRRRGESVAEWHKRLITVDMSELTNRQLDELTFNRLQADRARRRETRRLSPGANGEMSHESAALRRCMDAVQALSVDDRRRLLRWAEEHLGD